MELPGTQAAGRRRGAPSGSRGPLLCLAKPRQALGHRAHGVGWAQWFGGPGAEAGPKGRCCSLFPRPLTPPGWCPAGQGAVRCVRTWSPACPSPAVRPGQFQHLVLRNTWLHPGVAGKTPGEGAMGAEGRLGCTRLQPEPGWQQSAPSQGPLGAFSLPSARPSQPRRLGLRRQRWAARGGACRGAGAPVPLALPLPRDQGLRGPARPLGDPPPLCVGAPALGRGQL